MNQLGGLTLHYISLCKSVNTGSDVLAIQALKYGYHATHSFASLLMAPIGLIATEGPLGLVAKGLKPLKRSSSLRRVVF